MPGLHPALLSAVFDSLELLGGTRFSCHAPTIYQSLKKLKGCFSMYSPAGFYFSGGSFHLV